jgi:ribonucleoside-diphosphate reductase alpha chain
VGVASGRNGDTEGDNGDQGGNGNGKPLESTSATKKTQKPAAVLKYVATATAAGRDEGEFRLHEQIRTARLKGYEGDMCSECGQFTMVRNGTCLKCETCGATSGCS